MSICYSGSAALNVWGLVTISVPGQRWETPRSVGFQWDGVASSWITVFRYHGPGQVSRTLTLQLDTEEGSFVERRNWFRLLSVMWWITSSISPSDTDRVCVRRSAEMAAPRSSGLVSS